MRLMQRPSRLLVLLALGSVLLCADRAHGQADNPLGDAGLQILQGLSGQQRDSISGIGGQGNSNGMQGNLGTRQLDEEQQNLQKEQQRLMLQDMQKQRAELERLSPYLQPDEWIVVTIDSNPLPALPGGSPNVPPPQPTNLPPPSNQLPQPSPLPTQLSPSLSALASSAATSAPQNTPNPNSGAGRAAPAGSRR